MIRNDFVSNSSSSSFIVTTDKPQNYLIDQLVKNLRPNDKTKGSYSWNNSFDKYNREFIKSGLNNDKVALVIGNFEYIGQQRFELEECINKAHNHECFACSIIDKDEMRNFIENGKVKIKFEDLTNGNTKYQYQDYDVYEITQDSIDFTRWVISNCDTNHPDMLKLNDFYTKNKDILQDYHNIPKDIQGTWDLLSNNCYGLLPVPEYSEYVNDEVVFMPITNLLDKYEKAIREGKRIYRICIGYSGEGTDWSSYLWCHSVVDLRKNISNDILLEYDPWW